MISPISIPDLHGDDSSSFNFTQEVSEGFVLTAVAMLSSSYMVYAILVAYAQGSYMYPTHIVDYHILTYANPLHTTYLAQYERISTRQSILSTDSSRAGSKSIFEMTFVAYATVNALQYGMHVGTGSQLLAL